MVGSLPATGWSSSSPKWRAKAVLGARDVLVAEEEHAVLQQQRADLGHQRWSREATPSSRGSVGANGTGQSGSTDRIKKRSRAHHGGAAGRAVARFMICSLCASRFTVGSGTETSLGTGLRLPRVEGVSRRTPAVPGMRARCTTCLCVRIELGEQVLHVPLDGLFPTRIARPISLFDKLRAASSSTSRSFGVSAMLGVERAFSAPPAGRAYRRGQRAGRFGWRPARLQACCAQSPRAGWASSNTRRRVRRWPPGRRLRAAGAVILAAAVHYPGAQAQQLDAGARA